MKFDNDTVNEAFCRMFDSYKLKLKKGNPECFHEAIDKAFSQIKWYAYDNAKTFLELCFVIGLERTFECLTDSIFTAKS